MNYAKSAQQILQLCGGKQNISSITHCTTRLRLFLKDTSLLQKEEIQKMDGVIGLVLVNDEAQIVLGENLLPVYNAASRLFGDAPQEDEESKAKKTIPRTPKEIFNKGIGFISAAVTPMIPGLVAGGMLKVFLLLLTLAWAPFKDTQTYVLLSMLANIPFYFMSVFVAYGAAKTLGATPVFSMIVTACLVYPDFVKIMKSGDPVSILSLPVIPVQYASTLLPALLISICAYYCEKLLVKVIPSIIRPVFVGMGTIIISFILGITVLGPLGDVAGSYLVSIFLWPSEHFGGVAVGFLAACMPWLVMTGMHHAVTPFMVQAIANPGYDILFRPAYLLHNMAEGGACIGVGLRTKNRAFRAECFSVGFGCIVAGVSEPAIYGINLRLKRPLYGVMAGAAAGGIVAGFLGATAYVYGYSTLLAIPIFQDTILAILAGIVVAIVTSTVVTMTLGFDESLLPEKALAKDAAEKPQKSADAEIRPVIVASPANGTLIALKDVPDPMFSQELLGKGCGIRTEEKTLYAPLNGTMTMVAETKHAIGIKTPEGLELLIHVGIDTVNMQGKGFAPSVAQGDTITIGQPIMEFDHAAIHAAGYDDTVLIIVTNSNLYPNMEIASAGQVIKGQQIIYANVQEG